MSQPKPPAEPKLNLSTTPDYRDGYANSVQVRMSVWDFLLVFGTMSQDSPDELTGPVNLGNATEFSILELAELVLELTNSRSIIERRALPADDPKQRKPDASLAAVKLGWLATTSLADGLRQTIPYFDALLRELDLRATRNAAAAASAA